MRGQGRTSASSQPSATVFATSLMNEVRCQSCSNTRSIFSKRESSVKSHGSASKSATSLSGLKYAPQWPPHWKSERRKPLAPRCRSSIKRIAKRGDASPTCEPPAACSSSSFFSSMAASQVCNSPHLPPNSFQVQVLTIMDVEAKIQKVEAEIGEVKSDIKKVEGKIEKVEAEIGEVMSFSTSSIFPSTFFMSLFTSPISASTFWIFASTSMMVNT
eukprot:CAMPEP_0113294704 /NCGR_PEP_ID=MMETSP0008_2-20120614/36055_1 /TAXON_ID=97485 /ORGANISM="Prymnesium parvum" /LENGTH=215 /DNA_ID=CAMNT_0000147363 /DNA_START=157 /DNA_END=804 /DNA_ORIENTATION=- /assembly_acc=CAM_ASM_000153